MGEARGETEVVGLDVACHGSDKGVENSVPAVEPAGAAQIPMKPWDPA